jgi:hypothetical protein
MINSDDTYVEDSRFNERTHRLISAILVSLMMASAGVTVAQVGHQIVPNWRGGYMAAIGLLFALECFYSHRALKKLSSFSREWIVLISTQWVVNLIVIKLIVTLSSGFDTLFAEIPLWQQSFGKNFFGTDYIVAIIFSILVWTFVRIIAELLDEMGLDTVLIAREVIASVPRDRPPPRQRLMATVFAIGGGLVFLTASARVDTRALFANESGVMRSGLSPLEAGGAGALLYFLFGLALLSQAQYITLNTRWFLQGVPVSRFIATNWAIYSVSFLILIVLVVSVLPTNYSLGLLSVLGYLVDIILGILMLIASIVLAVVGFLLSLPFLLFRLDAPIEMPTIMTPQPVVPPPPTTVAESTPFPWLELLKSMIFWGVFLVVVGYSIAQYLRQHEEILERLRKIPGWKIVSAVWDWITGMFGGINQRVAGIIEAGRARLRPQQDDGRVSGFRRFTSFWRLSPRQKVLFYYHALLRRGDKTGLPRKESQTPEEYAAILERSLPTVENEITSLTDAFSEARYSRHLIAPDDVDQVKTTWENIRRVFRGRRG